MFEGQPRGLWALALANTGERFGYYTMLAVFILFLQANFGWSSSTAGLVYSTFLMLVYFLPLFGGIAADVWGYSKMVTIGIFVMFAGYALLSIPLGATPLAIGAMGAALLLVSLGTGLFKGNLQVMVGDLYNDPQYSAKRDSGFSLFYMLINVGALFAPTAAIKIMEWSQQSLGVSEEDSYHFAFAVACVSLIVSICIYYGFKSTFQQVLNVKKSDGAKVQNNNEQELSKSETIERIVCLVLVYAVVIFFWMAFHQNGATLTFFARDYVATSATGVTAMAFDVTNLLLCIVIVYGLFGIFQSKSVSHKGIWGAVIAAAVAFLGYKYLHTEEVSVSAPIFQQFNPCFVVALTPVSIALFGWLAKKGKEPKAPVKIGLGMLVAALAYLLMTIMSVGLPAPNAESPEHLADVSPNILVSTYLILTFAELLLSPIGIAFVTKVAPPKFKGMMMGGWFVATALGNFLVSIPTILWGKDLYVVWGTLMCICLVAALFIFSIIKKLNRVA
ncbi:MAG: peptide MFS transporter [Bacteroidaceae bacterium]|nr:peptide MFS transporter [Paraprevotella sp.]MDY3288696.1 peptide MFS transporter [Bacteroidaceae bacterium]MDY3892078.1 peptide MFS transporter [Bacteroidaceae bacterium]MDY5076862.1 peptide MFS transporter [Bacteroidaceae bacterium]MDY5266545.1 peptide MFS transporter [Bacteroidaceae bacterium]